MVSIIFPHKKHVNINDLKYQQKWQVMINQTL